MNTRLASYTAQAGATLIEVLVTVIILALGLLGLAGLQSRLQVSEVEAYQRSQAIILLNDIASRIQTNRKSASTYATGSSDPVGAGITCPTSTATIKDIDMREWCLALQGAGEKLSGSSVGAMTGGRGCIEHLGSEEFRLTVAWQGLTPIAAPPDTVACGKGSYDGPTGAPCTGDLCRRVVTTTIRIAKLD